MSYCRFLEGDVYAYDTDGGVQFWVSKDFDKSLDRLCNTYNEAYRYIKELRDEHGLDVPEHAIEALKEEAIEEAERFTGQGSAIADLRDENVKLRELVSELMAFVEDDDACEHCGHDAECVEAADGELVLPYEGQCLMLNVFEQRTRELGVEVD